MIQVLYHGVISTKLWIYHMYNNKHTRQKSLKKYMKSWRSRLARLNDKFDTYIKENYKVVDYQIKTPSMREHDLTWKPYGYYKRRKAMLTRSRCIALRTTQIIEARSAMDRKGRLKMEFDTDSFDILIDNCCSHTLTNDINDYIEPPVKSNVRIRGYNGTTNSTMVGTVKWKIKDDKGKIHNFILPNTYYSSSVETRLLSPQHWAQTRKRGRDSYCITYHDAIIMRWNKDKYQITAPLDNRKHKNVGVVRSATGISQYLTACQVIDDECTTLAYPATVCMDCQVAEITDDEASVQPPKEPQQSSEKEMDGIRPETPTEIDQMREEIFKDKEPGPITYDEEETEEEDFRTYTQDSQEYMHWHYKLNHPSHTVMTRMAKQRMLPRRITNILTTMNKYHTKPPMCNDCCAAKATRKPWRGEGKGHIQSHIKRASNPGDIVSVDQLESSIPGFIGQMTGKLTNQRIVASTIYVDHASDLSYVYHQTSMTSEETLKSKLAFEKFATSHGVNIKHYHADNGRFKDKLFTKDIEEKGQTISFCGVGAHHQNGIAEKRIGDLQRRATTLLLHAQRR
jgi:transposase InsO family protein